MKRLSAYCVLALLCAMMARTAAAGLDAGTVAKGLLEALEVGIKNAIAQTGVEDGFLGNPAIRIPLPDDLEKVSDIVGKIPGGSAFGEKLVLTMNRAAEAAAPEAKDVFLPAIRQITFEDALSILNGKEDEATQYLLKTSGEVLKEKFRPVIDEKIESVGALKAYNELVGKAAAMPLLGATGLDFAEFNLTTYVTNKAVEGMFHVLGEEEKKIRENPTARVTSLLETVFGSIGK